MNTKPNKLFLALFVALIFALFLSMIGGYLFGAKMPKKTVEPPQSIDWEARYPFDTVVETVPALPQKQKDASGSKLAKISAVLQRFGNLGSDLARFMPYYSQLAKGGYILRSKLTDPSVGSKYIRLNNGYWVYYNAKPIADSEIDVVADYASLERYLTKNDIPFLYVYPPSKECALDPQLPSGITTYTNNTIDKYLAAMDAYGVRYIDLRQTLHEEKRDHYSFFYKTDHHWTVEAGFWAAQQIIRQLNSRFALGAAELTDASYRRVCYSGAEFGSAGESVTRYVAQPEDFSVLFPVFENEYRLEIPSLGIDRSGSFASLFIDHQKLQADIDAGGGYAYERLLYGNLPYEKITNLQNPDAIKMVMIKDSFALAVAPYLAASCSELTLLDPRPQNGNFTGSIVNCIQKAQPDVVLVLQSTPQPLRLNQS